MRKEEMKFFVKRALELQDQLLDIEEKVWEAIKYEIRCMSSFGEHACLEGLVLKPDCLEVKVYDNGYDLYESEIIRLTYDKLAELMP